MKDTEVRRRIRGGSFDAFLLLAIFIVTGFTIFTNLAHYCYKMNADIGAEALLGKVTWESGEWIPTVWYPSSEIRIWQMPQLAALFYGITSNMNFSAGAACVVMTMGILLSAYFFISQFSFDRTQKLVFLLLCLVIPNHFVILELMYLFAAYYATHIIIMFLTLGIYAKLLRQERGSLLCILGIIMSFLISMQGLRGLQILYVPLAATELLRRIYLIYAGIRKTKQDTRITVWCLLMIAAGFLGTMLPFSVGQEMRRNVRNGFGKLVEIVLPHIMECLGFDEICLPEKLLLTVVLVGSAGILIWCLVRMWKKQEMGRELWTYLFFWIAPVITVIVVAFTTMESSQRYYFVLLYALAFGVVCGFKRITERFPAFRAVVCVSVLLLFVIRIITVYVPIAASEEPFQDKKYEVCQYLTEHDLRIGYADFELANTLTTLSNGELQIAAVSSMENMNVCRWLGSKEWYVPNVPYEGRTAYVVVEDEMEAFMRFCEQHTGEVRFDKQIGHIFIYEADYNFSNLDY